MCSQNYSNQIGKEIIQIGKSDNDFLSWVKKESGNVNNWTDNLTVEYNWFKNKDVNDKLMQYVSNHITDLAIVGGIAEADDFSDPICSSFSLETGCLC